MRTVVQFAGGWFKYVKGQWEPFDPLLWDHTLELACRDFDLACRVREGTYGLQASPPTPLRINEEGVSERMDLPGTSGGPMYRPFDISTGFGAHKENTQPFQPILARLRSARLARFDPDALRAPSGLIPETSPVNFLDDRGLGLAGVYFAIKNRDDDTFASIIADVRRHFPTIKGVRVKAVTSSEVVLEADLTNGTKVEARRMSEGLLYYLAFAALQHLDPVSLLLVEEPENGLHPARIVEVMRILREISRTTQVLLATHSPLVINEMQPEEVSVVTRKPDEGTKVTPMKETANFEKRSSVYALGELWLSFADGVEEAPLLEGRKAS
jgi:hypothetical protein